MPHKIIIQKNMIFHFVDTKADSIVRQGHHNSLKFNTYTNKRTATYNKSVIQRSDRRTTERGAYFGTCTVSSHVESWSLFWREISWLDQPSSHKDAYIWWCFIYICIRKIFVNGVAIWFEPISIYLITKYQHQEPPYRKKWSNVLFQQANKMEKRTLVYDIHW